MIKLLHFCSCLVCFCFLIKTTNYTITKLCVLIKLRTERPRKLGIKTTLVDVEASVVGSVVLGEGLSVVDEEGAPVLVAC